LRGRARRKISDIVKAGLAGLHDRLIRKDTKTDRKLSHPTQSECHPEVRAQARLEGLAFFLGMERNAERSSV